MDDFSRIRVFQEMDGYGRRLENYAIVLDPEKLPEPQPGTTWVDAEHFNLMRAVETATGFRELVEETKKSGFAAFVQTRARP